MRKSNSMFFPKFYRSWGIASMIDTIHGSSFDDCYDICWFTACGWGGRGERGIAGVFLFHVFVYFQNGSSNLHYTSFDVGLWSGIVYVHATGVTFQYFDKIKTFAQGVIIAGASLRGVYWPIGIRNLIDKVGFGWANRIIGFVYIPMVIITVVFLRPRVKPRLKLENENFFRVNFKVLLNLR